MSREKNSFIKLIRLWGIVFLIALAGIIIAIDILTSYRNFNYRVDKMRIDYLEQQKQIIKREVEHVVDMINYEKSQSEALTKIHIKSRVYKVYNIVQNIYEQNKGLRRDSEIKKMIVDVLRPVLSNGGSEYFIIDSLSGKNIFYPTHPSLECQNIINLQDSEMNILKKKNLNCWGKREKAF